MADVNANRRNEAITVTNGNRYILGNIGPAQNAMRQTVVQIDLNGNTLTYNFQGRVPGATTWQSIRATPLSTGTVAASGTASEIWLVLADGMELALNMTAGSGNCLLYWS